MHLIEEEQAEAFSEEHFGGELQSFGRMTAFHGQMGMFTRALTYILSHGADGLKQVAEDAVLVNPAWVDVALFDGLAVIPIDSAEPFAANALLIGDSIIYPTAYPRTRALLERRGIDVRAVDVSELIKAEGAVTCCSLIVT